MRKFICILLIIIDLAVISLTIYSRYFYSFINVSLESKEDSIISDFDVTFNDTSLISIINASKGQTFTKEFTIKNTSNSTLYNIILYDLINNYEENTLTYNMYINDIKYISNSNISDTIISNVNINSNEEHNCKIEFISNEDSIDKTLSAKIIVKYSNDLVNNNIYSTSSIMNRILSNNNYKYNDDISLNESGLFYTYNSNNGNKVYYFRGSEDINNNIVLNNMCFKIVRTTENNGLRLIYSGIKGNNGCSNIIENKDSIKYNINSDYNAYVGISYASPNSSIFSSEHYGKNKSNILDYLYKFYENNFNNYNDYFIDSLYCNNRNISNFEYNGISFTGSGVSNINSGYQSFNNFYIAKGNNYTYKCNNYDSYSTNKDNGNGYLKYPVGTITLDEVMYAGLNIFKDKSYLNYNYSYWTMSAAYFYSYNAYTFYINNDILIDKVSNEHVVRPVLTINANSLYVSGDGSINNPYIIKLEE